MKTKYYIFLFLIVMMGMTTKKISAQAPVVLELREQIVTADSVKFLIFGLFLTTPDSCKVGEVKGDIVPNAQGQDPFNFLTVNFSRNDGPVIDRLRVWTPAGSGLSFFTVTIPGPDLGSSILSSDRKYQFESKYFSVSTQDQNITADTVQNVFQIKMESDVVPEQGKLLWKIHLPYPNPLPSGRFANPSDDQIISDPISYGATAEEFANAMAQVQYPVYVDSIVTTAVVDTETTAYYFTFLSVRQSSQYPLYEIALQTWVEGINDYTPMLSGNIELEFNGFATSVYTTTNPIDLGNDFINATVIDTPVYVGVGGYSGLSPHWTLDFSSNDTALSPLYVTFNGLNGGTTQPLAKILSQKSYDFGETSISGSGITAQFLIKNSTENILDLGVNPVYFTGNNSGDFTILQQPGENIASGDSSYFVVLFLPDSVGSRSAYMVIKDNGRLEGETGFLVTGSGIDPVPVELTSFSAKTTEQGILLSWSTATETNNRVFEVERTSAVEIVNGEENKFFITIGSVGGSGTSTEYLRYNFIDNSPLPGKAIYRLKQIDYDGSFEYSNEIEVNAGIPIEYALFQNYPNPFNPSTSIKFQLPVAGKVRLELFNILGERITSLVNQVLEAGYHTFNFSAANLPSGIYIYSISAGEFSQSRKMMLIK